MRHGTSTRRQRNRGNGGGGGNAPRRGGNGGGNSRMQVYDSNGPDVRIRGTAHQVAEKYLTLAKDAASMGELVLHESYLQHAEHYQRIINSWGAENVQSNPQPFRNDQNAPQNTAEAGATQEDDLSLPASILGDVPKAISPQRQVERTPEYSE